MDHTVIWTFCSRSIAEVLPSTQVILIPDPRQPNGCWTLLQLPHHSSKTTCVFRDKDADDQKGPAPWIMQTSREVDQSIQSLQFSAAEAGSTDQHDRLRLSLLHRRGHLSTNFVTSPRVKGPIARLFSRHRLCLMHLIMRAMVRGNPIIGGRAGCQGRHSAAFGGG